MEKRPEIDNPLFEKTEEERLADSGAAEFHLTTEDRKTDILKVIQELKSQLESSYVIRDALESDLSNAKDILSDKEKEVDRLSSQLTSIKKQLPTIKGLQDEIDFLNEERRTAYDKVENLEVERATKETTLRDLQSKLISAEEEKSKGLEGMMEIRSRLTSEIEKSRDLQKELAKVARDKDSALTKVNRLETEIEKLRESRKALDEIHQALAETRKVASGRR